MLNETHINFLNLSRQVKNAAHSFTKTVLEDRRDLSVPKPERTIDQQFLIPGRDCKNFTRKL